MDWRLRVLEVWCLHGLETWRLGGVLLRRACADPELHMRFYNVFAHIRGSENLPARPNSNDIWAWGGGTWGEGLAVLEDWMLGGLEVCFYDVFAHIQKLRCAFTTCLRTSRAEFFPARPHSSEIWAWVLLRRV